MKRLLVLSLSLFFLFGSPAFSDQSEDELLALSYEQTKAGNFDDALQTLQSAAKQLPESSTVHTRLGGVRILRKEYSAGIKDFQQAITLDQTNAAAFVGMAVAYLHMGKYNLARAALNEAATQDPTKQPEIDKVLSWIDQRANAKAKSVH